MHSHARRTGLPLAAAALQLADSDELPKRAASTIGGLMRQFLHWREQAEVLTPSDLLRLVMEESGYNAMLSADRSPESAGRAEKPHRTRPRDGRIRKSGPTPFPLRTCQPGDG